MTAHHRWRALKKPARGREPPAQFTEAATSEIKWEKRVLKAAYKTRRVRGRYSLKSPKQKTAAKVFVAGAGGSLAGSYPYDRIKEKKDKMRG